MEDLSQLPVINRDHTRSPAYSLLSTYILETRRAWFMNPTSPPPPTMKTKKAMHGNPTLPGKQRFSISGSAASPAWQA